MPVNSVPSLTADDKPITLADLREYVAACEHLPGHLIVRVRVAARIDLNPLGAPPKRINLDDSGSAS